MVIYFGADHRGFELKEHLREFLRDKGYEVVDMGAKAYDENDDYPLFAAAVGKKVGATPDVARGILVCGSGVGVDVVANKFSGVRSAFALSPDQMYLARKDDDVNVASFAADFIAESDAEKIVQVFMATPFSGGEKYRRRLGQISGIEGEG